MKKPPEIKLNELQITQGEFLRSFNQHMPEAPKANDLIGPAELQGSEAEDLRQLRQWIFKSQALHLKRKEQPEAQESKETKKLAKEVEFEQPRLI